MKTQHLFQIDDDTRKGAYAPLAERMRPRTFDEFVGQTEILDTGQPLREAIERDTLQSIILWGPPGSGKTTIARLIAAASKAHFVAFSAVLVGIKEVKAVMTEAEDRHRRLNHRTIVFIDEIHRFNKAQQDAFLPPVESGDITLVGATTENPSFEVTSALLSRSRVFVLKPLTQKNLATVIARAISDPTHGLGDRGLVITPDARNAIAQHANGDARVALNLLDMAASVATPTQKSGVPTQIDLAFISTLIQKRALRYDKGGDEHFNIISALHKSMRNSDPDASVYWLARMLEAGEDPLYIARRLVRFASEDIGNADPQALTIAIAAKDAVHFIGLPEGNTALAQAVIYLATTTKSNAVYRAYTQAAQDAHERVAEPVPLHLRNAPTKLMKDLDFGKDYRYAHDEADGISNMDCLPPGLIDRVYYEPATRGYEAEIKERLAAWKSLKRKKGSKFV